MFVTEGALVQDACMAVDCPDLRGEAYMVSWLVQLGSAAGRTLAFLLGLLLARAGWHQCCRVDVARDSAHIMAAGLSFVAGSGNNCVQQ